MKSQKKLWALLILAIILMVVLSGCGGTVSEEGKIENVITKFFQALSD